jgi:hypothetical protein
LVMEVQEQHKEVLPLLEQVVVIHQFLVQE